MRFRYIGEDGTERQLHGVPELARAIKTGELQPHHNLFDTSTGRWSRAQDHDAAAAVFATVDPVASDRASTSLPRQPADAASIPAASANRRILARFIDGWILGVPAAIVVDVGSLILLGPPTDEMALRENNAFWTVVAWFGVMLLDPLCTKLWGGSPGKLMLGMRVRSATSSPLTAARLWRRSLLMWFRGLALGFPIVQLVTGAISMRRVTATGRASWDNDTQTVVIRVR